MKYWIPIAIFLTFQACVPLKKHQDAQALADKYLTEKLDCEERLEESSINNDEMRLMIDQLEKDLATLQGEKAALQDMNAKISKTLSDYESLNEVLTTKQKEIIDLTSSEQDRLLKELDKKQKEIAKREQELATLSQSLKDREAAVSLLQADVKAKSARIDELEANLAAKDEALLALKNKIKEALKGFSSDQLTVIEKNGKVYVSLSEKLMFSSGSFAIDKKGEEALVKLAGVLKEQKDVDIVVEGHTDNVPYNGAGLLKDNWDLSVKRATTVTRILVKEGLSTENLSAAGRGDSKPVAANDSAEGKAANRRTEIILAPQLDKIFDLLEGK